MGDVDLFTLTPDGQALTVNAKWLQHLQERLLGEDGHPVKVKPGEDPHAMGLVLEWVYGSIVSTAEKVGHAPWLACILQPGFSQHTLPKWLELCGGCCTAEKLCSDLYHIFCNQAICLILAIQWQHHCKWLNCVRSYCMLGLCSYGSNNFEQFSYECCACISSLRVCHYKHASFMVIF